MGNLLDRPIKDKVTHYFPNLAGLDVGASGMQGWRLEQEDAHVSVTMENAPDHVLVGVLMDMVGLERQLGRQNISKGL